MLRAYFLAFVSKLGQQISTVAGPDCGKTAVDHHFHELFVEYAADLASTKLVVDGSFFPAPVVKWR